MHCAQLSESLLQLHVRELKVGPCPRTAVVLRFGEIALLQKPTLKVEGTEPRAAPPPRNYAKHQGEGDRKGRDVSASATEYGRKSAEGPERAGSYPGESA
jgi:hypothetical protein